MKRRHHTPVGRKIAHLEGHEHVPHKQAIAEALHMKRSGRLTQSGKYIKKGHRRSHKS